MFVFRRVFGVEFLRFRYFSGDRERGFFYFVCVNRVGAAVGIEGWAFSFFDFLGEERGWGFSRLLLIDDFINVVLVAGFLSNIGF